MCIARAKARGVTFVQLLLILSSALRSSREAQSVHRGTCCSTSDSLSPIPTQIPNMPGAMDPIIRIVNHEYKNICWHRFSSKDSLLKVAHYVQKHDPENLLDAAGVAAFELLGPKLLDKDGKEDEFNLRLFWQTVGSTFVKPADGLWPNVTLRTVSYAELAQSRLENAIQDAGLLTDLNITQDLDVATQGAELLVTHPYLHVRPTWCRGRTQTNAKGEQVPYSWVAIHFNFEAYAMVAQAKVHPAPGARSHYATIHSSLANVAAETVAIATGRYNFHHFNCQHSLLALLHALGVDSSSVNFFSKSTLGSRAMRRYQKKRPNTAWYAAFGEWFRYLPGLAGNAPRLARNARKLWRAMKRPQAAADR